MRIARRFKFDAAHYLPNYDGVCSRLHGHTWYLEVEVSGSPLPSGPKQGMVIDFSDLKALVAREVIDKMDHTLLNDRFENPTAEELIRRIWNTLLQAIGDETEGTVLLTRLRLYESPDSYAEYDGKET